MMNFCSLGTMIICVIITTTWAPVLTGSNPKSDLLHPVFFFTTVRPAGWYAHEYQHSSCSSTCTPVFTFTSPSRIFVGDAEPFRWTWNPTDFQQSQSGAFIAMLIRHPDDFACHDLEVGSISKIVESFAVAKNPDPITTPSSKASGSVVLSPRTVGSHLICTYG
ncbi:hypothetical protein L218DRAFT_578695 [Marasmius fiardii PR-910]|nr:hypothetical protein L218DRAFT_578695 [Marasmius fiardii PR-910]